MGATNTNVHFLVGQTSHSQTTQSSPAYSIQLILVNVATIVSLSRHVGHHFQISKRTHL